MSLLKKLRIRLTLINAVVSGIILLAMALGALNFAQRQFLKSSEDAFALAADSVAYYIQSDTLVRHNYLIQTEQTQKFLIQIEDGGNPFQWQGVLKSATSRDILFERAWLDAKAHGVDIKNRVFSSKNYVSSIAGDAGDVYHVSIWVLPGDNSWHSITILRDMHEEQATLNNLTLIFLGCALLGLIILGFFSYGFAGRAIQPVEKAQKQQTQFVQAASHELRTPAAVIQASAGALLKAEGEDLTRFANAIEHQSRHLSGLVEDLMLLASSDTGTFNVNFAPVELHIVLQEAADDFSLLFSARTIQFFYDNNSIPPIWGDAMRIKQAVHILLDNALEHTPEGGRVGLHTIRSGNKIEIIVTDTGPGVTDEHKPHIFERFYRVDKARGRAKAHYGLGLSIANEIMIMHNGKITVADNKGGGTVFTLQFPIN
jgi:OmpR-family two-component system manganese-sensing sensor histidine kinase